MASTTPVLLEHFGPESAHPIERVVLFGRPTADRVVFMDGGVAVEEGVAERVISGPTQARTKEFLRRVLDPTHIDIAE